MIFFFMQATFDLPGIYFVRVRVVFFVVFTTVVYIVHFLPKLVWGSECCIRICSGNIPFQIVFFFALRYYAYILGGRGHTK